MNRSVRVAVSAMLMSGCVSWEPTTIAAPTPVPANRVIRVWSGTRSVRWRAVQVTTDSLSGIPASATANCDTCRVALPLSAVDSTESQTSQALPLVLAAVPFIFLIASIMTYDSSPTGE